MKPPVHKTSSKSRFSSSFWLSLALHLALISLFFIPWSWHSATDQAGVSAEIWTQLPEYPKASGLPAQEKITHAAHPPKADITLRTPPKKTNTHLKSSTPQKNTPQIERSVKKASPKPQKQPAAQPKKQVKRSPTQSKKRVKKQITQRLQNLSAITSLLNSENSDSGFVGQGTGAQGISANYAQKIKNRIKPRIIWGGRRDQLVTVVDVRCAPDGRILNAQITQTSGNSRWDAAVLQAIYSASPLPVDQNGKASRHFSITFQANE